MLKTLWQMRAADLHKESQPTPPKEKWQLDYEAALDIAKRYATKGNYHLHVCFNDNTGYKFCARYRGARRMTATMELRSCAAIIVPTDDPIGGTVSTKPDDIEPSPNVCGDCVRIFEFACDETRDAFGFRCELDRRIIWRDVYSGGCTHAEGQNNLGDLVL